MAAVLLVTRTHKGHAADALITVKSAAQIVPRVAWKMCIRDRLFCGCMAGMVGKMLHEIARRDKIFVEY